METTIYTKNLQQDKAGVCGLPTSLIINNLKSITEYAIIRNKTGQIISKSKNLRGILEYNKKNSRIKSVSISRIPHNEARAAIFFKDDSYCLVYFANYDICCQWFKRRVFGNPKELIAASGIFYNYE